MTQQVVVLLVKDLDGIGAEIEKQLKKALAPGEKVGEEIGKKVAEGFAKQTVAFTKAGLEMAQTFERSTGPIDRALANFVSGFQNAQAAASAFTGVAGTLGGSIRSGPEKAIASLKSVAVTTQRVFSEARRAVEDFSIAAYVRMNSAMASGTERISAVSGAARQSFSRAAVPVAAFAAEVASAWRASDGFVSGLRAVGGVGAQAFQLAQIRAYLFAENGIGAASIAARVLSSRFSGIAGSVRQAFTTASVRDFSQRVRATWTEVGGLSGAMSAMGRTAQGALRGAAQAGLDFVSGFRDARAAASAFIGSAGTLGGTARQAYDGMSAAVRSFGEHARVAASGTRAALSNAFNYISSAVGPVAATVRAKFTEMWKSAEKVSKDITNVFSHAFKGLQKAVPELNLAGLRKGLLSGLERLDAMDHLAARLERIMGSARRANEVMELLSRSASKFSFDQVTVGNMGAKLLEVGVNADRLIPVLGAIGNIAAHTGKTSAAGFEEVGQAFLGIARAGTFSSAHLQSLSALGINALEILAEQAGTSAGIMEERINSGAIGSERAISMLVAGLESGSNSITGSMGQLNNTVGGAFRQLKDRALAVLGQLFEPIKGPIIEGVEWVIGMLDRLPQFVEEMSDRFAPALDNLSATFGPLGNQISSAFGTGFGLARTALEELAPHLERFTQFLRENKELVALVTTVVGGFAVALGLATVATQLLTLANTLLRATFVGHPIGLLIAAIAALVAGVIYAYNNFEGFRNVVDTLWAGIMNAVQPVVDFFRDTVWPLLVEGWNRLVEAAEPVVEAVKGFFAGMGEEGGAFSEKITEITDWISERMSQLVDIFRGVLDIISAIWSEHGDSIMTAVQFYLGYISAIFSGVWTAILGILQGVWQAISGVIEGALSVIQGLVNVFAGLLTGDWSRTWEGIKQIASGIWNAISSIIGGVLTAISGIISGAITAIVGIWQAGWNAVKEPVSRIATNIVNTVTNLRNRLFNAGKNVIRGLIDGIRSMISNVSGTMSDIAQTIRDKLPFSPAKDGPLRRFPPERGGRNIARYLADGLERDAFHVDRAMTGIAGRIHANVPRSIEVRRHAAMAERERPPIQIVNNYPQAEPTSTTVNRSLQYAASIGVI